MVPSRQVSTRQVLTRRQVLGGALLLAPMVARAADWPERPLRMIIPFAPGAGADIVGRTFAEELAKALGQAVVVDNKGGSGGLMGTAEAARAPADGYTLLLTSQGTTVFNIGLYKTLGYDPLKDFVPVTASGILTNVLVVSTANPAKTVADLIAQARAKLWRDHLRLERRRQQPPHVGRDSGAARRHQHATCALSRRSRRGPRRGERRGDVGSFNAPTVLGQIKAGKLRALAVTTRERSAMLPDVPTMIEAGVPNFEVATWLGFALPVGTAPSVVARLNAEINRIGQLPQVKEKLLIQGFEMMPPASPEAARKLIESDQALWLPIIKQSGAKAE